MMFSPEHIFVYLHIEHKTRTFYPNLLKYYERKY